MLKGPQTLLHRLCWLTSPWVALPGQRVPTCLLSESIPSHPISFSTLLVPQLLPGPPPAAMRQQPSCVLLPDDVTLLWITPLLQRYKYVKLEQENNSTPGSHKLGQSCSHYKLLHQEPAPRKARQGLGSLLWHPNTELCVGRAVALPSVPAFLPSLLHHKNCR